MFLPNAKDREAPGLDLTPVIDIVFMLLIFFLVATTFQQTERELRIALPRTAPAGPITNALREIVLNVRADGTLVALGKPIGDQELSAMLTAAVARNPGQKVNVRGDRAAPYEAVARALALCKAAGIDQPFLETVPVSGAGR
jgi:biopolymer transport protein ExbD